MESIPKQTKGSSNSTDDSDHDETLLPGLPNHLISQLCLASAPPSLLFSVCHSWRRFLYSPSFPPYFCLYAILSPSPALHQQQQQQQASSSSSSTSSNNSIELFSLDPISSTWNPLPSPPKDSLDHLLHHHPSFLSRKLPIQSLTVSHNLVLMAGTGHKFMPALSRPLVFNPESNRWFFGPLFSTPRRWCVTGSVRSTVYLASGVGSHYRGDVARSMDQWDMRANSGDWEWESMAPLKDGRFSREAIEAVGYKEKLYMVNVKGNAVKEGLVYNVEANQWESMPSGLIAGWNGPAAAMNEEVMYVVDEVVGALSEYQSQSDSWRKVIELPELKHAEQISAGRGRVCVVCANGEKIVVVDVVARPAKSWVVHPPSGQQVVSLHILPRMKITLTPCT
ncbi:hypothetical protein Tsubulata_005625 [Turnera subulata]|uniref:F-box domain-containing protein n=1 Tax=Turnera subulata TaxID=218843 RepID=A0A9Q0JAH8_9ROSI|nr:hypothetical protein Tsubulata_005625 [Turnera subulata]